MQWCHDVFNHDYGPNHLHASLMEDPSLSLLDNTPNYSWVYYPKEIQSIDLPSLMQ